jgi:hypothetical protein
MLSLVCLFIAFLRNREILESSNNNLRSVGSVKRLLGEQDNADHGVVSLGVLSKSVIFASSS